MRRIRKTASTIGLSVGRPQNYDGDDHVNRPQDAEDVDDDEIVNDSMKANGTRVWYR
jgi:chloride channel 3/4/5